MKNDKIIQELRFKRGFNAGQRGLVPDESTEDYLNGFALGRKNKLAQKSKCNYCGSDNIEETWILIKCYNCNERTLK